MHTEKFLFYFCKIYILTKKEERDETVKPQNHWEAMGLRLYR